jgi:GNAT superfamily N-acetyltransferase
MSARRAGDDETDSIAELLALAFAADPVWTWAFPDESRRVDHLRAWWGLFVASAVPHGHVWTSEDRAAVAVWIPPGTAELTEQAEAAVEPLLRRMVGSHADAVLTLLERFETNHPHKPPHYYLSLLGTHPSHRGKGKGMALLAETLRQLDAEAAPAYLESSNPVNHPRYERLGFVRIGEFGAPDGGPQLVRMWRDPR